MNIKTKGIVIGKRMVGENNYRYTLLTDGQGVLHCFRRGAKKGFGKDIASMQPLAFSAFELFLSRDRYVVDGASLIDPFLEVATDMELQALAIYLGEITAMLCPEKGDAQALRLYLNTLHVMRQNKMDPGLLKAVYELRILAMSGFFPDVEQCKVCGEDVAFGRFSPGEGQMTCGKCGGTGLPASMGTVAALRHILSAPLSRLFGFVLEGEAKAQLMDIAEAYAVEQLDKRPQSLDYFHTIERTLYESKF